MKSIVLLAALLAPLPTLAADYSFSGRVVDDAAGVPLGDANVVLYKASPIGPLTEASAVTASDGTFTVGSNTAGSFDVTISHSGHVTRSHIPLGTYSSPATVSDIEVRLVPAGVLSVRVIAAESGLPLDDVRVVTEGNATRQTDATGNAMYTGLTPGDFRVCVIDFQSEHLNACVSGHLLGFSTSLAGPTVSVLPGQTMLVELSLLRGGAIAGRIVDAYAGVALADSQANFDLRDSSGSLLRSATRSTDASGNYRIAGVPAGSYLLVAQRHTAPHFAAELYPEIACNPSCPYASGAPVGVGAAATVSGIDFSLSPASIATGYVTDVQTGAPLSGVQLLVYTDTGFGWRPYGELKAQTGPDGKFDFPYLPANRNLRLGTSSVSGYVNESWPDTPCGYENCGTGTTFKLNLSETRAGFDFGLSRGPVIRGRTIAIGTERPVSAEIRVYRTSPYQLAWLGTSNAAGEYVSSALPAGTYNVMAALGEPDSTCSWYGDAVCSVGPALEVVTNGVNDTIDIDIGLRTILVLRDGFE